MKSDLVKFYEGGLSLRDAGDMSLHELYTESLEAARINREQKQAMENNK